MIGAPEFVEVLYGLYRARVLRNADDRTVARRVGADAAKLGFGKILTHPAGADVLFRAQKSVGKIADLGFGHFKHVVCETQRALPAYPGQRRKLARQLFKRRRECAGHQNIPPGSESEPVIFSISERFFSSTLP